MNVEFVRNFERTMKDIRFPNIPTILVAPIITPKNMKENVWQSMIDVQQVILAVTD